MTFSILIPQHFGFALTILDLNSSESEMLYRFIDRMSNKRFLIGVKNSRPYSLKKINLLLNKLVNKAKSGEIDLSHFDQMQLKMFLKWYGISNIKKSRLVYIPKNDKTELYNMKVNIALFHNYRTANIYSREKRRLYEYDSAENWLPERERFLSQLNNSGIMIRPKITGRITEKFAFETDLQFYLLRNDIQPDYIRIEGVRDQKEMGYLTAGLTKGFAAFNLMFFDLSFGKMNLQWGPGRNGNLLLSSQPLPIDLVKVTKEMPHIKFEAFTGILGSNEDEKYISAHRIEFDFLSRLSLGIAESVVYSKKFEFRYANPFQIYVVSELTPKSGPGISIDNKLVSLDAKFLFGKKSAFYSEFLIDDFQPQFGLRSFLKQTSNWGTLIGFHLVDFLTSSNLDFRSEYTFLSPFTYTHHTPSNYTHFYTPIGHEIGPDSDQLWIELNWGIYENIIFILDYSFTRYGIGRINSSENSELPLETEWSFLDGVVEYKEKIGLETFYQPSVNKFIKLNITNHRIRNNRNIKSPQTSSWDYSIRLNYGLN